MWGGCQVGNTIVEVLQTAIASFRSMLRMIIFDIEVSMHAWLRCICGEALKRDVCRRGSEGETRPGLGQPVS